MELEISSLSKPIKMSDVPDGDYTGLLSGYCVTFLVHGHPYVAHMKTGLRGMNIKCTVVVKDGAAKVSIKGLRDGR